LKIPPSVGKRPRSKKKGKGKKRRLPKALALIFAWGGRKGGITLEEENIGEKAEEKKKDKARKSLLYFLKNRKKREREGKERRRMFFSDRRGGVIKVLFGKSRREKGGRPILLGSALI